MPTKKYWHPQIFRPSDGPGVRKKMDGQSTILNSNHVYAGEAELLPMFGICP